MKVALYGRVSTVKQDTDLQREVLRKWAKRGSHRAVKEYYEVMTGSTRDRPRLKALLKDAERGQFEAVVVTRLDRLARSLSDLLSITQHFKDRGIKFICTEQAIDTSSPQGRLFFQMAGAFAEFERSLIVERTRAGRAKAEADGKVCHRPRKDIDEDTMRKLVKQGWTNAAIAQFVGVSQPTISRRVRELRLRATS